MSLKLCQLNRSVSQLRRLTIECILSYIPTIYDAYLAPESFWMWQWEIMKTSVCLNDPLIISGMWHSSWTDTTLDYNKIT